MDHTMLLQDLLLLLKRIPDGHKPRYTFAINSDAFVKIANWLTKQQTL